MVVHYVYYVLRLYFILLFLFQKVIAEVIARITFQLNFKSTIAAFMHYEGPSPVNPQRRVNFDRKMKH